MQFEIDTEPLPVAVGCPRNGRKRVVTIACTAVICVLLMIVYLKLESVSREGNRPGYEPGLQGPHGPKEQGEAPEPPGPPGCVKTFTEGVQNLTASKGIVQGIIAGTYKGVFIIPFDSREQRTISSNNTCWGVAFNWQSRKVYWIDFHIGIKTGDLDGSSEEVLISKDTSELSGLAVDQITGNFYYGVRGSNASIRICDSKGKTCAAVASGVNNVGYHIWDIALFPTEGLMFWSSPYDRVTVTRANMDGTNATVMLSEHIFDLYVDELTEKLYWTNYDDNCIGRSDLNGYNRNIVLNTTLDPTDIAVDGDTLYFGGHNPNGVYSVSSNRQVSYVANTTGDVGHIAFYGSNKDLSRSNPCKDSPCANLCVLTRLSYTCL